MKSFKAGIVLVALVMVALGFMSCHSNSEKLISITITPADPVIVSEIQLTATGTFSGGLALNYTSEVIWSSSDTSVATVGITTGVTGYVTIVGAGTTTITAVEPHTNLSGVALLTVATPSTITITPVNPFMVKGTSHQFDAIASYVSSGVTYTQSMMSSPTLTWHLVDALDPLIATISRGLVTTGTITGTVTISATDTLLSGVSGTTLLTVTASALKSILVTAATPTGTTMTVVDSAQPFYAEGTFGDLTTSDTVTFDLTTSVNWTSSSTGTVIVSNASDSTKGFVTPKGAGTAFIIATDPISSVTGSVNVTVNEII